MSEKTKQITPKFSFADGTFDMDSEDIICVAKEKYQDVHLCLKSNMHITFAEIKLYDSNLFVDKKATFDDAFKLGTEIVRRWHKAKRNCRTCHYLNGDACLHDNIPDSYTARYISFSGCGLHIME